MLRISERSGSATSRVDGSAVGFMLVRIVFGRVPKEARVVWKWKGVSAVDAMREEVLVLRGCWWCRCWCGGTGALVLGVAVVFIVAFAGVFGSLAEVESVGAGTLEDDPATPWPFEPSSLLTIGTSIVPSSSSSSPFLFVIMITPLGESTIHHDDILAIFFLVHPKIADLHLRLYFFFFPRA
jgi:hypothetical protein